MSCSTNRLNKLIHGGLAGAVAPRIGLSTEETGEFLEKVFQQSEYPKDLDQGTLEKAKQSAGVFCDNLFKTAQTAGYQLGHKGAQTSVKQTLGYANLWRTLKAVDEGTPLPPLAKKIAREDYGVERCSVCGRFYPGGEGCQNDHSKPVNNTNGKAAPRKGVRLNTQVPIPPQPPRTEKLPVFVYGTLRTGMGNWNSLLKGRTTAELPATLPGSKMYSTGLAWVMDATEPEPAMQVQGDLMFLDEQNYREHLRRLDGLEGYNPATDAGLYRRVARMVKYTDENGVEAEALAWVYYAGDADKAGRYQAKDLVEDGDWLRHKGYDSPEQPAPKDPALSQKRYYYAFGSNMNDTRMTKRGVNFTRKVRGTLDGFRLSFNKKSGMTGIGYANIEPGNGEVEGVLYEITEAGLRNLDKYEGVNAGHYRRDTVKVRTPDGELVEAAVYVAEAGMTQEGLKPTREYLDHLLAGKEELSPEYYAQLAKVKAAPNPEPPKTYNSYSSSSKASSSYKTSSNYTTSSNKATYGQASMFGEDSTAKAKRVLDTTLDTLGLETAEEAKLFRLAREYGMSVPELLQYFIKEKLGEQ